MGRYLFGENLVIGASNMFGLLVNNFRISCHIIRCSIICSSIFSCLLFAVILCVVKLFIGYTGFEIFLFLKFSMVTFKIDVAVNLQRTTVHG